jgi:predicted TIM-barrel fold metal-dependent hydrolase
MNQPIAAIDTHLHLIYPGRFAYSWTKGIGPLEGKAFRHDDYAKLVAGKAIQAAIFMETDPDEPNGPAEAKFVSELASQPGSLIRGVIATCRPERDGFDQYIQSIQHPKLVGCRRILHVMPDDMSRAPLFAENVRRLGRWNLTFDLCFLARQLPAAIELARNCPDVQMILDHCGVPDIASGQLDPWRQHIRDLAALPNVACKISGVPTYCKPGQATLETIRPWVMHCIECFGPDRLVWGGDWPVVVINSSLPDWIDMTRQLITCLSESEQRKVLHDNAVRIYRIKL